MRFKDIIGHEELKKKLVRNIDSGRISHAQLFSGQMGCGTLPLAMACIQYIHCTCRHDGDSCGECPSCKMISTFAHPDHQTIFPVNKLKKKSGEMVLSSEFLPLWREFFNKTGGYFSADDWYAELDLGKTLKGLISTKEAENMILNLQLKSYSSPYKTVLIWLPEVMKAEASNRILKILEEPWDNTVFFLVTEREDLLLSTIISRTQSVYVPRIESEELIKQAILMGVQDTTKARNISRLSGGSLLELKKILSGADNTQQRENFEIFASIMRNSYKHNHIEILSAVEDIAAESIERIIGMLIDFSRLLREAFMIHAGMKEISYLWGEEAVFCQKFAPFIDSEDIEAMIENIEQAIRQIRQNGNAKIILTHCFLSICKPIERKNLK
ncbi:MAG: DNA polymerase III subunit delta [Alistipes sp.]|nr:DNA polymerase III subunit delta [Candidatus Alistipes equi]